MARHGEILLNLVDLRTLYESKRVFLTIDDLGLQCRIELIEVDSSWGCTQRLEHRYPKLIAGHPDLQALQVLRRVDWPGARRHVAKAVVQALLKQVQIGFLESSAHVSPELPVHCRP